MTAMSRDELIELTRTEVTTDITTAGRAYGLGRANAYALARRGEFPVDVLKIGTRYKVRTALLAADLLHGEAGSTSTADPASTTSTTDQANESQTNANPLHLV